MGLDKKFLLKGLLQYNYFPSQKKDKEELPPILNSECLTTEISEKLKELDSRKGGYDQVEYKVTRYNNVPRSLSIPHPVAYAKLCHSLYDNWEKLKYITKTENSLLIPKKHHNDSRIIIMEYEYPNEKIKHHIKFSFNKKFYVNTDISNFFPSIYSHSIPWALVGVDYAKKDRDQNKWFNQIDKYQRLINRDETNGIPIGPASSNIICELILAKIDKELKEDFKFIRYIDDYTAYSNTYEEAEDFILRLSEELSRYKLLLNIKKTLIKQLPSPSSPEWKVDIATRMPNKDNINSSNIIQFLDYALNKQVISPDGSVLKYAAKSIIRDVEGEAAEILLKYLINLCIKYPILLPLLKILFDKIINSEFIYADKIWEILNEHAINKRSDAMTWSLYYLNRYSQPIPKKTAEKVIESEDCISILFLYLSKHYDNKILDFCDKQIIDKSDLFLLDHYWLLLYQLFFDEKIPNPYQDKTAYKNHLKSRNDTRENAMRREIKVFDTLKSNGVSFIESI